MAAPTGDLTAELTAQGYRYVTTKDDLAGINSGKVLGLFSAKSHLDYELDRVAKGRPVPSRRSPR